MLTTELECHDPVRNAFVILLVDVFYMGLLVYLAKAKLAGKKKILIYFVQVVHRSACQ